MFPRPASKVFSSTIKLKGRYIRDIRISTNNSSLLERERERESNLMFHPRSNLATIFEPPKLDLAKSNPDIYILSKLPFATIHYGVVRAFAPPMARCNVRDSQLGCHKSQLNILRHQHQLQLDAKATSHKPRGHEPRPQATKNHAISRRQISMTTTASSSIHYELTRQHIAR